MIYPMGARASRHSAEVTKSLRWRAAPIDEGAVGLVGAGVAVKVRCSLIAAAPSASHAVGGGSSNPSSSGPSSVWSFGEGDPQIARTGDVGGILEAVVGLGS